MAARADKESNNNDKKKKGSPDFDHRNWSELPDLPLRSILDRLFSLRDLCAFAGVCPSWRSLYKSGIAGKDALASRPPMILRPVLGRAHRRSRKWLHPVRCLLESPADPSVSYRCMLSSATLTGYCIGYSFGNLVFLVGRRILICDVFTGDQIVAPELPHNIQNSDHGFLTAPPSSPECRLLLSSLIASILIWRVGTDEWSTHLLRWVEPPIKQVFVFKEQVYAFDYGGRVFTIHFSPKLSLEPLVLRPLLYFTSLPPQLVECGGELLSVCFDDDFVDQWPDEMFKLMLHVFRLDFSQGVWVEVENLGDWCLFIDVGGRCPVSCVSPTRWGGRSNCIYIVGSGCDSWSVYSLDSPLIDHISPQSPLCPKSRALPSWPSPIWVYPSMFF